MLLIPLSSSCVYIQRTASDNNENQACPCLGCSTAHHVPGGKPGTEQRGSIYLLRRLRRPLDLTHNPRISTPDACC